MHDEMGDPGEAICKATREKSKPKPSTKRGALIVEVNGKLHQALLSPAELTSIIELAAYLHGGTLPVMPDPIETIALSPAKGGCPYSEPLRIP